MKPKGRSSDWRYEKRFIPFSAMPGGGDNFPDDGPLPDEEPDRRKLTVDVDEALQGLDPLDRQIIELELGWDGNDPLKKTQIAEKLGISRPTLYKRRNRAHAWLRPQLKHHSPK